MTKQSDLGLTWRFRLLSGTNALGWEESCGDNESGMGALWPLPVANEATVNAGVCAQGGLCGFSLR